MNKQVSKEDKMPFLEHLEELRKRVMVSIIALFVCAIAAYFFAPLIINLLTNPVKQLVFIAPTEAFVTRLKISLISGVFLASPVIFYQLWRFIKPALLKGEQKYVILAVLSSVLFLIGGLAFANFVVLPIGIRFFLSFQTDKLQSMLSISNYIGFVARMLFAFGLIFQLPVVVFFLTKLGIIEPTTFRRKQRIAIVVIFIGAALLTPPDVFSQLLMVIPLVFLFEISIWVSIFASRKREIVKEER